MFGRNKTVKTVYTDPNGDVCVQTGKGVEVYRLMDGLADSLVRNTEAHDRLSKRIEDMSSRIDGLSARMTDVRK